MRNCCFKNWFLDLLVALCAGGAAPCA
ncbi:hypothetical protein L195_g063798, partial [Trifolium pratense]